MAEDVFEDLKGSGMYLNLILEVSKERERAKNLEDLINNQWISSPSLAKIRSSRASERNK